MANQVYNIYDPHVNSNSYNPSNNSNILNINVDNNLTLNDNYNLNCIFHHNCNFNSANSFSIVHQNIRSLRKNFDIFVSHLDASDHRPNLICLSEIWIYDCEKPDFVIPGYTFYATCNNTYSAGGVAVFLDNEFNCEVAYYNFAGADILQIDCEINNELYCFVGVYRLQNIGFYIFLDEFSSFLDSLKCKNLILLGDFNLDILSLSASVTDYMLLLASHGLESKINQSTRFSTTGSSCLDHIFVRVSRSERISLHASVSDLRLTDHCMTCLNLSNVNLDKSSKYIPFTKTDIDFAMLNNILKFEFWDEVFSAGDASSAFDAFLIILQGHLESCKIATVTNNTKCKRLKPWMSLALLKLINKKK